MKRFLLAVSVLMICATIMTSQAVCQTAATSLTQEQQTELQKRADALTRFLAVTTDSSALSHTSDHKTMADVADKALDLFSGAITSTVSTLQNVAPDVWRIMIKQQYAKAFSGLVIPWGIVLMAVVVALMIKKNWKFDQNEGYFKRDDLTNRGMRGIFSTLIPTIVACIAGFYGLSALKSAVLLLVNPEYYALRDIILLVLNKGQGM